MKRILITAFLLVPGLAFCAAAQDYFNGGLAMLKKADYDKAIRYFNSALKVQPDYWQAYEYLGETYFLNSNRTEALVAMKQSLALHPDNPELKKFVKRIESSSPWIPAGSISLRDKLAFVSIAVSILTLVWTLFWTYTHRSRSVVTFLLRQQNLSNSNLVTSVFLDFTLYNSGNKAVQVAVYRIKWAGKKEWEKWNFLENPQVLSAPDHKQILHLTYTSPGLKVGAMEFGDGVRERWPVPSKHLAVMNEALEMVGKPKRDLPEAVLG